MLRPWILPGVLVFSWALGGCGLGVSDDWGALRVVFDDCDDEANSYALELVAVEVRGDGEVPDLYGTGPSEDEYFAPSIPSGTYHVTLRALQPADQDIDFGVVDVMPSDETLLREHEDC